MAEHSSSADGRVVRGWQLSAKGARLALERACERADELEVPMSVAVVDSAGALACFERMDGALPVSGPLALDKAWTAAVCRSSTDAWTEITQPGGEEWGFNTALGGRLVVQAGGIPLILDDNVVGAIGVSGGSLAEDESCAAAGASFFDSKGKSTRGE